MSEDRRGGNGQPAVQGGQSSLGGLTVRLEGIKLRLSGSNIDQNYLGNIGINPTSATVVDAETLLVPRTAWNIYYLLNAHCEIPKGAMDYLREQLAKDPKGELAERCRLVGVMPGRQQLLR